MDSLMYNFSILFLTKSALRQERILACSGCINNLDNQLGHVSDCGIRCSDEIVNDLIYIRSLRRVKMKQLEKLTSDLIDLFSIVSQHSNDSPSTLSETNLREVVCDRVEHAPFIQQIERICSNIMCNRIQ